LFLFNCETERIDHGDFKYSNFEVDRQPEKPIRPPKIEVVYTYIAENMTDMTPDNGTSNGLHKKSSWAHPGARKN